MTVMVRAGAWARQVLAAPAYGAGPGGMDEDRRLDVRSRWCWLGRRYVPLARRLRREHVAVLRVEPQPDPTATVK